MNTKIKIIFFVVFFILVAAGAGFYFWQDYLEIGSSKIEEIKEPVANLETGSPNDQNVNNNSGIELLNKLTQNIPKGTAPEIISQIQELSRTLKDNNDYLQGWLQLGILRKNIGDLEGAAETWQYATIIRPESSTAYLNLGDLYGYYLRDNQKAEEYLLRGIKAEPSNVYTYYKTYEFYTDTNQSQKARQILEQGIAANPQTSESLKTLLIK